MTDDGEALKVALDLLHVPSQVRLVRARPLPNGTGGLLRIVGGDADEERRTAERLDRSRESVRNAAVFFVEQILFAPDADSYRVLGAAPTASSAELRSNMANLLSWLHPDREGQGERAVFAGRVTKAWNDVKTPERRAAYDRANWSARPGTARSGRRRFRKSHPQVRQGLLAQAGESRRRPIWIVLLGLARPGMLRRVWSVLLYGRKR